jgi:hypothetical protein
LLSRPLRSSTQATGDPPQRAISPSTRVDQFLNSAL